MAGNEITSQTELFTGWSSVVHQPCEDPEDAELPSTVDMAAFTSGLNVDPVATTQNANRSDSDSDSEADSSNSGSDDSQSGSRSGESSDSDSSSSSQESSSRSPSPEFSVTSSQTNGLRLTITSMKKPITGIGTAASPPATGDTAAKTPPVKTEKSAPVKPEKCDLSSSSESACSSDDSDSESSSAANRNRTVSKDNGNTNAEASGTGTGASTGTGAGSSSSGVSVSVSVNASGSGTSTGTGTGSRRVANKVRSKVPEKKEERKVGKKDVAAGAVPKAATPKAKSKARKVKKVSSVKGSTCTSSDSDESMLASCSLQEIRQEDLAAILPDQQDCDTFGGFEYNRSGKNASQPGDMSDSDMELPQQAVTALIQRTTESSSDEEEHSPPNPGSLYANSLLQQFVAQTQMLNSPNKQPPVNSGDLNSKDTAKDSESCGGGSGNAGGGSGAGAGITAGDDGPGAGAGAGGKRKRGRPRKGTDKSKLSLLSKFNSGDPNISPDSGIQNSPDHVSSPEPSSSSSLGRNNKDKENRKNDKNNTHTNNTSSSSSTTTITNTKTNTNTSSKVNKVSGVSVSVGVGEKIKVSSSNNNNNNNNKKSKDAHKKVSVPLTSNRFDRLLYANSDRVLYPPRRKASKQTVAAKKGPGRPPKDRSSSVGEKSTDGGNKSVKNSGKNSVVQVSNPIPAPAPVPAPASVKNADTKHRKNNKNRKTSKDVQGASDKNNGAKEVIQPKTKSTLLFEICERVSKRLELSNKYASKTQSQSKEKESREKEKSGSGCKVTKHQHQHQHQHRNSRPVPATKSKGDGNRLKYTTFKNTKLMHSRHKHRKHKKYKFKIIKPITASTADPKINLEIEKLVADFVKLCVITQKSPKENVSDLFKSLKKATKKRKASEHGERKKKKQNDDSKEASSNEQRLPLKKRHYHLSTNDVSSVGTDSGSGTTNNVATSNDSSSNVVADSKSGDKNKSNSTVNSKSEKASATSGAPPKSDQKSHQSSPKHVQVIKSISQNQKLINNNNNNDYTGTGTGTSTATGTGTGTAPDSHIEEAIEACINKFSNKTPGGATPETKPITATTPKKRHRLEQATVPDNETGAVVKSESINDSSDESKSKQSETIEPTKRTQVTRNLSDAQKKSEKRNENAAQIITRKKNRIEDLASSLISRISPSSEVVDKKRKEERGSVIRYPVCKKAKPTELEKLDTIASPKPTGIFLPTVDLELNVPFLPSKDKTVPKKETPAPAPAPDKKPDVTLDVIIKIEDVIISAANHLAGKETTPSKKKFRKKRPINRTGFPTVKKKKKKVAPTPVVTAAAIAAPVIDDTKANDAFERVPKQGEEYSKFVERTDSCEALSTHRTDEMNAKWEAMSECDSLPQDERTEIEADDVRAEVKLERMTLRARDSSPATSVDTRVSDKREDDLDDLPLDARISNLRRGTEKKRKRTRDKASDTVLSYPKRRLRDISPASSIEPQTERRLREERSSASGDETRKGRKILPRWRKKYLVAGLFSDYYKEGDEIVRLKRSENAAKSRLLTYVPEEHPYGLLPAPHHCGKYLRNRKLPFQLPYDLWWQHTRSQLPGRDVVPSWNYKKIRTNVYNVKSNGGACEPQTCNCSPASNCGDDCINRLVLAECPSESHRCHNQKIQRHEWSPGLEKFMTDSKGWGIRTKQPIKNGEFILEYVGEVVSDQEFKERMATIYGNDTHHYCLHLDGGLVIDGHRMGGDGRFVNHSCKPNCEMQKWSVNGQFRMALFSLRDIGAGEELTYDYNFSLFNPAEGQECLCGSENCRGVIGGKSQRVRQLPPEPPKHQPGRVGRPRKNNVAKKAAQNVEKQPVKVIPPPPIFPTPQVKPMSHQQKCFIIEHHCFLLRNLTKVRKVRSIASIQVSRHQSSTPTDHGVTFMNHLNALQKPRNIKTRRLAQAEDNPELNKSVKLAAVLKDVWKTVINAKDDNGKPLCSHFMTLPSKRKTPDFYQKIADPIDLSTVEQNIATGIYRTPEAFDVDMNKVFNGYVRFYGRSDDVGIAALRLKKVYTEIKQQSLPKFQNILGKKPFATFGAGKTRNEEEDIIRCICGMYRDEGLMIQCERCLCWQHSECVMADTSAASYHCERCVPRDVDYEIPLDEFTEHGHRFYMTLMRGDLQLRQGDTVYVLRDIPIPGTDRKHTYKTIGKIDFTELDIFRIERLWKDKTTGQRLAYGHHYLRPHETYHEPTRKFFPNEVMRVPLYEAVPVELVICHCWVMDINTYCKGRPTGAPEEHIYICEYRVDKSARLFSKVSKSKFPICTKSYAFEKFETRLKVSRTYTPHEVDESMLKHRGRKPQEEPQNCKQPVAVVNAAPTVTAAPPPQPPVRTLTQQKTRLNKILLNLLGKMPTKQSLDVSYLLEGGRRRKKQSENVKKEDKTKN